MKIGVLISFLIIATTGMSQVKFGVGYGLQVASFSYSGFSDDEAYFRNKLAPSQQLSVFVEPFKIKGNSHFQVGFCSQFLFNGYRTRRSWSWGDAGVGGHTGSTTVTSESAVYRNFQYGLNTGYVHYFGNKRNVKFGTGFFVSYMHRFYEDFSNQKSTKRHHDGSVIYTDTGNVVSQSSSVSYSNTIKIPTTNNNFLGFNIPLSLQFSKNRLMELKLNLGWNYAVRKSRRISPFDPSGFALGLEFHYFLK